MDRKNTRQEPFNDTSVPGKSYEVNGNAGRYTNYAIPPNQAQFDTYGNYASVYPQNVCNGRYYSANAQPSGPRFGLIRGYHRQMYEAQSQGKTCCGCSDLHPSKGPMICDGCNWGIVCGCVLLGIGVFAVLMGFMLPQKVRTGRIYPDDINNLENISIFVDIFVIFGLSVLSVGGLVVSFSLLWPFIKPRRQYEEDAVFLLGGDVYVKAEEKTTNNSGTGSFLNVGFHKDFEPGDLSLQRIQPRPERKGPIDLPFRDGH